jgi:hypothetical protein
MITKEKRRRIFKQVEAKGQIVAKSYINLDFRKTFSKQFVTYNTLTYKVIARETVIL